MDKLLEVLASLLKEKGLPKKGMLVLMGLFLAVSALASYASIYEQGNELITNIGTVSFYVFAASVLLLILGYAQKEYETGVMGEIGELVEIIRSIAYEYDMTLNVPFECTRIDREEGWIEPGSTARTYFMKKRGKSDGDNYSGILIVDKGKTQTAHYWETEDKKNYAFELGGNEKEIRANFPKAEKNKKEVVPKKDYFG